VLLRVPFEPHHDERIGVLELSRIFDVTVLDFGSLLFGTRSTARTGSIPTGVTSICISDMDELKALLARAAASFAFDYLGTSAKENEIRQLCAHSGLRRVCRFSEGVAPAIEPPLGSRLRTIFRRGVWTTLGKKIEERFVRRHGEPVIWPMEFAVVEGNYSSAGEFQDVDRIVGNHFEYEQYQRTSVTVNPSEEYILYLDQDVPSHPDIRRLGLVRSTDRSEHYAGLDRLFSRLEVASGLRVVIARHPRAVSPKSVFGKRQVYETGAADLVPRSRLVLAHWSTAVALAVLWNKPLAFVTSAVLKRTVIDSWIRGPAIELAAPIIDVDRFTDDEIHALLSNRLSAEHYERYCRRFLIGDAAARIGLWAATAARLDELSSPSN